MANAYHPSTSRHIPADHFQQWSMNPLSNQSTPAVPPTLLPRTNSTSSNQPSQTLSGEDATFEAFLDQMPKREEDASRHMMFTELIKLKTKSIELQIAEARKKEKEAELELEKWKSATEKRLARESMTATPAPYAPMDINTFDMGAPSQTSTQAEMPFQPMLPPPANPPPPALNAFQNVQQLGQPENPPTPINHFDLEAMMHDSNLESLFSWLPEYTDPNSQQHQQAQMVQPQQQHMMPTQQRQSFDMGSSGMYFNSINTTTPFLTTNDVLSTPSVYAQTITSPVKRSASPFSDADATSPAAKRTKRTTEKKIVVERSASCAWCKKTIARIMFRAPRSHIPEDISIDLRCPSCAAVECPSALPDHSTAGTSIGTVDMRKRLRTTLESEDEEKRAIVRRQFCDVCQRVVASGMIVGGDKENMNPIAEIVCAPCDGKYQRCTDCGGGGGPRVGIGKWRTKQVFPPGRKTCSLSHTRLGDRLREIGVHVTPTDFSPEQLKEVLTRTKGLWNEKTLARLGVPEMLEIDLPPNVLNPLRDHADVEDIVTRNWPTREAMIRADGADPARFKRLLGLIWAHPKARRAVRTIDLEEEEYSKTAEDDEADMSTVLANVKRTNVVIPPGSELVGMWGGEWDMQHGALLISTLIPFEGADGEDSTALSVGEMITTVQVLRQKLNSEREEIAKRYGKQPVLIPQCEHLWVVSGGTMPLVRERVADVLIRKRSFVHVEEYLTRHPDFVHALNARPVGLHPDLHRPIRSTTGGADAEIEARPLILVRWLGKEFDAQRIKEIKLQEFGGKAKLKGKKAKSK